MSAAMKKFSVFYLAALVLAVVPVPALSKDRLDHPIDPKYIELLKKSESIQTVSDLNYHFSFVTSTPDVIVQYEISERSKEGEKLDVQSCLVGEVKNSNKIPGVTDNFGSRLNAVATGAHSIAAVVKASSQIEDATQFNFLDSVGNVIVTKWLDNDTGFARQTAMYDGDGALLVLDSCQNLDFSKGREADRICGSKRFEKFLKQFLSGAKIKSHDPNEIERACREVRIER